MAAIDLSKAKIGDKFKTRDGQILEYIEEDQCDTDDKYILSNECGRRFNFYEDGGFYLSANCNMDLAEQVFYKPISAMERQELQRRQEVVELADRIFFSDRGNMYSFKECVEIAEHSVNIRDQYLKDGKLC